MAVEGEVGEAVGQGGVHAEGGHFLDDFVLHGAECGYLREEEVFQGLKFFLGNALGELLLDEVSERLGAVSGGLQRIVLPCLDEDEVVGEALGAVADYPEGDVDVAEEVAEAEGGTDAVPVDGEVTGSSTEVLCAEGGEVVVKQPGRLLLL